MKEAKNELMQFVAGIVMLAVGLYILSVDFSHLAEEDFHLD